MHWGAVAMTCHRGYACDTCSMVGGRRNKICNSFLNVGTSSRSLQRGGSKVTATGLQCRHHTANSRQAAVLGMDGIANPKSGRTRKRHRQFRLKLMEHARRSRHQSKPGESAANRAPSAPFAPGQWAMQIAGHRSIVILAG